MKKYLLLLILTFAIICDGISNPADSVTLTFRTYRAASPTVYVPGEFNSWGPNSNGVISPGAPSTMVYNSTLSAWLKTYTFKIKDPADTRRRLADSVWQYKFNQGGTSTGWYSDPLNPEQNPADNNNSVLRLTRFFWFQYYGFETSTQLTRITAGLVHANSDSITMVRLITGQTPSGPLTVTDITSNFDPTTRIVDYTLPTAIPKNYYIRLTAINNLGDSVVYKKGGYVIITRPMPAYVKHGVTLPSTASNDSTSFRIRVPGKEYILLRIAPLGTNPITVEPLVMRRATTNDDWWLNVKLPKGDYEYLYEIENGKTIYDPWGRWNGQFGSRFSTDSTGLTADNYVWKNTAYQRPPLNKIVIYELNVGEFAGGYFNLPAGQATFRHFIETIPFLDSLGINAIELMPINDYGIIGRSGFSWGYDLNSYFALEPGYGTPADFKALVDSAHGRGIAVIVDVVFNHINETSALWQMLPNEALNPYFKLCTDLRYNEDGGLCFFKDIDHWTNETQELVYNSLKMWIDEYKVDGFRYDYTQGIGWNINEPTKGILGWANKIHQDYNGQIYQIVEHLPESPALIHYSGITSGWHDSFRDKIFDEARFRNVSLTDFENLILDLGAFQSNDTPSSPSSYANRTEPVNGNVNHDEQSLIYEMVRFQSVPETTAVLRDKLYAPFMFLSLGIPMLWQGMEFAEPRGWTSDGEKLSYRPVQFSRLATERGQSHYSYYKKLIFQRKHNPALFNGELRKLWKYTTEKVLVWGFEDINTNSRIMAIANLSNIQRTVSNVPWLATGDWYDVFDQSIFTANSTTIPNFTLPAYTAKIFSNKPDSVLVSVRSYQTELPDEFKLYQNYPNPFNPSTTIRFDIPKESYVKLKVYNLLGQEVATLVDAEKEAGVYNVEFRPLANGSNFELASGVYFYRLEVKELSDSRKSFIDVKKLILLK